VTLAEPQEAAAAPRGKDVRQSVTKSGPGNVISAAIQDLWEGWRDFRELWLAVGWFDIRKRYRRSVLGPFWITVSLGIFVAGLTVIYGPMLSHNIWDYAAYLAFGFIAWNLVSETIMEGCGVFVANSLRIQQMRAPLSLYIYEMIWRNLLLLAHNFPIYLIVIAFLPVKPAFATLLLIPGVVLVTVTCLVVTMFLGTLCARFRDIQPIVMTVMRMMFLLTPVLWYPDQLPPEHRLIAELNPFTYLIDLIREPLLGKAPPMSSWAISLGITAALAAVALPFYGRFCKRIPYWV
jgi:ABC-2 type transport system permease protein/lipopolysaccharide transport system permease protein